MEAWTRKKKNLPYESDCKGEKDGKKKTIEYNLLDRYDTATKTSSMAEQQAIPVQPL